MAENTPLADEFKALSRGFDSPSGATETSPTEPDPFDYQKPTDNQTVRIQIIRQGCKDLAASIKNKIRPSRERSLALTKLEEVSMWANKAIVFEPPDVSNSKAKLSQDERDSYEGVNPSVRTS